MRFRAYLQYRVARRQAELLMRGNVDPVILYQMGKVGSSTIVRSLEQSPLAAPVLHVHWLSPDRMERARQAYARQFPTRRPARHLIDSVLVSRLMAGWPPRPERFRVVTLVRDPVARNASTFFQTLDLYDAGADFPARIRAGGDSDLVDELLDHFIRHFDHGGVLTWFDDELGTVFDVDVLEPDFPFERGFATFHGPRADILLLRLEDFDRTARQALEGFLGVAPVRLVPSNVAQRKYYADAYREFVQRLRLPDHVLDRTYGSRLARSLYRDHERARFRARWSVG